MNIIKFNDIVIEDDEIFNTYYKGKYAYAINWKTAAPLSLMTQEEYVKASVDDSVNFNADPIFNASFTDPDDYVDQYGNSLTYPQVNSMFYSDGSLGLNCNNCTYGIDTETYNALRLTRLDGTEAKDPSTAFVFLKSSIKNNLYGLGLTLQYSTNGSATFVLESTSGDILTDELVINDGETLAFDLTDITEETRKYLYNNGVVLRELSGNTDIVIKDVYVYDKAGIVLEVRYNKLMKSCIAISDYMSYVDTSYTESNNSVDRFVMANGFTPDDDITLDELKQFRTWLATNILILKESLDETETITMNYYKEHMSDSTVLTLGHFPTSISSSSLTSTGSVSSSTCACSKTSTSYITTVSTCDSINIYRRGVYDKMVEMFREVNFWNDFAEEDLEFLKEFRKYIDNIIKVGLPLYISDFSNDLYDCGCLSNNDTVQLQMTKILNNLSQSLSYIIDGDVNSHKNFIADSFYKFASKLYEQMEW